MGFRVAGGDVMVKAYHLTTWAVYSLLARFLMLAMVLGWFSWIVFLKRLVWLLVAVGALIALYYLMLYW